MAALAWKDKQSDPDLQQDMTLGILQSWVETKPEEAVQYAKNHSNDSNRLGGIVANSLAGNNPAAAKAFVESLPPGDAKIGAAVDAAMRLAHDDPAGTAAWINGLPVEAQSGAAGAVATQYAPQDPAGALAWIDTLRGDIRDSALAGYATSARDRADGIFAALAITDEGKRFGAVMAVAEQWKAVDPVAFRQWLATSGLPLETREALLPGGN